MLELIGMKLRKVNATADRQLAASRPAAPGCNVSHAGDGNARPGRRRRAARHQRDDRRQQGQHRSPWKTATAIDLAGRDILDAVQTSVNPKVIDVPNPRCGQPTIDGVAKDGIQLKVKARVTVRTNIKSLVGGATEETVVARVGEGIVNAIGSAEDYKHVLENPDTISKAVLNKGLDANTAFEILSIDIAEITSAKTSAPSCRPTRPNPTSADSRPKPNSAARWPSPTSRKTSPSRPRTGRGRPGRSRSPRAIAEAFRSGNLGVMDYYKLRNVQADTTMREAIAKPTDGNKG